MPRQLQPCWSCCCLVSKATPCLPLQREDAANQPPVCDRLWGAAVRMASLSAARLHRSWCRLLLVDCIRLTAGDLQSLTAIGVHVHCQPWPPSQVSTPCACLQWGQRAQRWPRQRSASCAA